jgi:type II secretory pathway pseudopilin PulG
VEAIFILAVVVIVGAVAIPRMSRGDSGAAGSALVGDLALLRNAISLYASEHGGLFPQAHAFEEQLTRFTDARGESSSVKTSTHTFGPYLRRIPPLPVGSNKGQTKVVDAATGIQGIGGGWYYESATGRINANLIDAETDRTGRSYNAY